MTRGKLPRRSPSAKLTSERDSRGGGIRGRDERGGTFEVDTLDAHRLTHARTSVRRRERSPLVSSSIQDTKSSSNPITVAFS